MKKSMSLIALASFTFGVNRPLFADDTLQFFQEEANVVSSSRLPQSANQSPATVYVVTAEDIKDSGALTIPESLRGVPGVEVLRTTTGQSEVGIRGLDQPINNRVLVLIDGRSVQSGYFNNVVWESLPIEMNEIDRIEVVEGPASAIYGADALSGVINIITKKPEQMQGGEISATGGERTTEGASLVYGHKKDNLSYRMGGGWDNTHSFVDSSKIGGQAGKFDGQVNYALSDHSSMSFSGGINRYIEPFSINTIGVLQDSGLNSFLRTDYVNQGTTFRAYWNRLDSNPYSAPAFVDGQLTTNQVDLDLEQAVTLFSSNHAVVGGNYRKNTLKSSLLANGGLVEQDLWSLFFEDKWELNSKWLLMTSGRVDRHPLTAIRFSPRGSLLYTPFPDHVFRISAGTAFRNPTLIENYINDSFQTPAPAPLPAFGLPTITTAISGSRTLSPETVQEQEVSYDGHVDRYKVRLTAFHYTLNHAISPTFPGLILTPAFPPFTSGVNPAQFANQDNSELRSWGGEWSNELYVTAWLRLLGNYSYEYLYETTQPTAIATNTPRHQANVGFRTKAGGWTTQWTVDWVDATEWPGQAQQVPAYFMLNSHVGYAFAGRLAGLECGVSAFNLLNHDHYEVAQSLNAEIVKSTLSGTVSYKF